VIAHVATALVATAGVFLALACARDTAMTSRDYFARLESDMRALDNTIGTTGVAATDIAAAPGDTSIPPARLRSLAASLDALRPPSAARDAHHDLRVASLDLADALESASAPTRSRTRIPAEWSTACHALQDRALTENLDVDLRCATALPTSPTP
jgi:hypothetical protein